MDRLSKYNMQFHKIFIILFLKVVSFLQQLKIETAYNLGSYKPIIIKSRTLFVISCFRSRRVSFDHKFFFFGSRSKFFWARFVKFPDFFLFFVRFCFFVFFIILFIPPTFRTYGDYLLRNRTRCTKTNNIC